MEQTLSTYKRTWQALAFNLLGVVVALVLWQIFTTPRFLGEEFSKGFSPSGTFHEFIRSAKDGTFMKHAVPSLDRIGVGLGIATAVGIPLGILIGYFSRLNQITTVVFQLIRMTSPLAWMPIAIILFGVGSKPIYFLIAVAAVWPIMINTAHGVRSVNPLWVRVVRMLGGRHLAVLHRAIIPAVIPDMLTGLRIALGIAWVVLVPAEMLGVSSGLGYYILDTRDRFNYGELMAVILVIGMLGFLSDSLIRLVQSKLSWRSRGESDLVI